MLISYTEFASEIEYEQLTSPKTPAQFSMALPQLSSERSLIHYKKNMYNRLNNQEEDKEEDDVTYYSSPIGSSLDGHTGHSADEVSIDTPLRKAPAGTAKGHRLRRLLGKPSAERNASF